MENMETKRSWQELFWQVFVIFQIAWFNLYHADLFSTEVAYLAIVVCFVFSLVVLFGFKNVDRRDAAFLAAGIGLTCVADVFLTLCFGNLVCQNIGVAVFVLVQVCYMFKIHVKQVGEGERLLGQKKFWLSVVLRMVVFSGMVVAAAVVLREQELWATSAFLVIVAILYVVNLAFNIVFSALRFKKDFLFVVGLVLLLVCDLFIGFDMLGIGFSTSANLPWVFYMPSQLLLALSCVRFGRGAKKN
jgi:hypothetical protein